MKKDRHNLLVIVENIALIVACITLFIIGVLVTIHSFENPSLTEMELTIYTYTKYKYLVFGAELVLIVEILTRLKWN